MNLGEFKSQISANIRRGSSLDSLVPKFIRQGALWLERNQTLQYMRKFATISVDPDDPNSRYVTLENTNIKTIEFLRWDLEGEYKYLTLRDPMDLPALADGTPQNYYLDGVSRIVFDARPDEALNGELMITRYSSWPTLDNATHWLMDWAEDVLEAQAMIQFGKHARDPDVMSFWGGIRDQALPGLYAADQELRYANSDMRMEYNGS